MKYLPVYVATILTVAGLFLSSLVAQNVGQVTYPLGGGGGGGGIPQGGPLTQDLDFNGFAAENVGTMTAAYIVGVSGGNTSLDGGLVSTDGSGTITAVGFSGDGGDISVGGFVLAGLLSGLSSVPDSTGGLATTTAVNNGFSGKVNNDSGAITTDGSGNLTATSFTGGGGGIDLSSNTGDFGGTAAGAVSASRAGTADTSSADGLTLHGTDGSTSGLAAFQSDGSFAQAVAGTDYITPTGSATLTNKSIGATQLTGTIATARLGSGTASSSTFLRGDQSYATPLTGTTVYAGNFSGSGTATTAFVVSIGHTMANTNYTACVTPVNALSSAVFNVTSKSTTQFTVNYLAGLTGTISFDWTVTPYN